MPRSLLSGQLAASLGGHHGSMAVPVEFGLLEGEAVVRGGFCKKPVVLQNLMRVNGATFLPLWKTSAELSLLLTGFRLVRFSTS